MPGPAGPRAVYTDMDGTLLGLGGSIFRTAAGDFTLAGARALELIDANGARLVLVSGRSARLLREDARILGAEGFIAELGCLLVRDGEEVENCAPFGRRQGLTVFEEISETGAPELLFQHFGSGLAYHDPWHRDHRYTHLMRGCIDIAEATRLLREKGLSALKVADNGVIEDLGYDMKVPELHAYHLMPSSTSKGSAIELDLRMAGLKREDVIACGDSDQDLDMARAVRTLYLLSGGAQDRTRAEEGPARAGPVSPGPDNVVTVAKPMVEGFLEAMKKEFPGG
ncbi:MAG: HAD family hydrolase [Thermoleophilia bacterium]|nr:HAD family hydrolase [Thermoleophilia bacterium]